MEESFVCYGDYLMLRGDEFEGFLTSYSFTDPSCFLQEVPSDTDLRFISNTRSMVFQILPKLVYDNVKELRQLQAASSVVTGTLKGTMGLMKATTLREKDDIDKLVSLSQRVAAEDEVNDRTIQQRTGEYVLYGQEVQLRHMTSKYFLKQKLDNADHDKSCMKVETSENGSSGVHFRVESRFKFKQEGDKVIYDDLILFRNSKNGLYLHVSDKPLETQSDSAPNTHHFDRVLDFPPHPSAYTKTYEINLSSLRSVWQLVLFRKSNDIGDFICSGSVVQLKHTERAGLMVSEGVDYTSDGLTEVLILSNKIRESDVETNSGSLFVLEADKHANIGGLFGYRDSTGPQAYRLRHLTSGRLCVIKKNTDITTLSLAPHKFESDACSTDVVSDSLFYFVPTTTVTENVIRDEIVVKVASYHEQQYLSTMKIEWTGKKQENQLIHDERDRDALAYFKPIENDFIAGARYKVTITAKNVEEDAYQMSRVDPEEVFDAEFIRSSQTLLYTYGNLLRDAVEPERSKNNRMQRLLSHLIMFCIKPDSDDAFTCEGTPYIRRQQFMRELGIVDLVCRILSYAFDTGVYDLDTLTKSDNIIKVCTLCYRLLKHISADYRANEMYCAQWIGLFLNHVQRSQEANSFKAEETLIEILSDNKKLLEHVVTPEMISHFVQLLKSRERDEKYMKLLSVLCRSQEEPITSNQNCISEMVLNNPENCNAVLMRVRHTNSVIEIEVTEYSKWVKLMEIEDISERRDNKKLYRYFLGLLELVAELAYGRNHNTTILHHIYSFDVCFACGADSLLSDEIRSRFVRILLYLHIDQGEIQKLTLPNYARVFSDISTMNSFPRAKGVIPPALEIVKHFVYNFLRDLEGIQRAYETSKNRLVKEVLVLTQFMVEYGLYINEEELEAMIDPLVYLLDGTSDIVLDRGEFQTAAIQQSGFGRSRTKIYTDVGKEVDKQRQMERYDIREGNLVIMECKAIVCRILLDIIKVRQDMKLSNFLISFRDNASYTRSITDQPPMSAKHSRNESMDQMLPFNSFKKKVDSKVKDSARVSPLDQPKGPLAWLNGIMEDATLDIGACTNKSFVAVIMDLLLYKHPDLVNNAFILLFQFFTQRHSLLNALLNVQLLENEESINALSTLNEQLTILKTHAENAEFWLGRQYSLGFTNPRVVEVYATDSLTLAVHQQVSEIIAGMAKLCYKELASPIEDGVEDEPDFERKSDETSKSFDFTGAAIHLQKIVSQSGNSMDIDPEVFTFSEVPSRSFQRLLRNLRVYEPIIELVKYPCMDEYYSPPRHQLVIRFCLVFLAKFCRHNAQNQELLSNYTEYFIAAMPSSVFAITLVREIYQNNANLCLRLPIRHIRSLAKAIGDTALSAKKCGIIRTLQIFIRVNNRIIRRNQIEVMSQLSSYEIEHFKNLFETQESMAELQRLCTAVIRQYVMHPSKTGLGGITVPLNMQYFMEMLQIMALCCEDKSSQAEKTCQHLISVSKLMELLAASSLFWPLKESLMRFFYHVYLDVEDSVQEDDSIIWMLITDLASDLAYIYDNYTRSGQQFTASIEHVKLHMIDHDLDLVQSALSYVYEAVIPCLRQIFMKRGSNVPAEWGSDVLKNLISHVCDFHRISPKIEFSRLSCDFLILMSEIPRLQAFLDGISIPEILSSREALNKIIKSNPKYDSTSMEEGLKGSELQKIVKDLLESEEVQDAVDLEFSGVVQSFIKTDELTSQAFGLDFKTESKTMFQALIYLLDVNDMNMADDKLIQRGLRLLRKSVELEVKGKRGTAASWDTDDWIDYKEDICRQQNMLSEIGCPKLICTLVSLKSSVDIKVECILLAIALLLGGHKGAQTGFTKAMGEDLNNKFLLEIRKMLMMNFDATYAEEMNKLHFYQKELTEKVKLTTARSDEDCSSEENFDLDDETRNFADEEFVIDKEHYNPYNQLINILRFLQLLCEGHYGAMQDHLREQRIGGVLHGKSVDFILIMSGYLGAYMKMLHFDNIHLGFQLLDTLTEVVQGPCRGNQWLLSQPKNIDQCRDLLTCLKHSSDQELRGFTSSSSHEHISSLKSKTVNLLLSLLEGEVDLGITRQISESLDVKRCKERMLDVFKNFVTEKLGLSFDSSVLSAVNRNLSRDSFEGPIEEGFNLYILLTKLADDFAPAQEYISVKSFEKEEELVAFNFFKQHTARIEVVIGGRLQRTYFPIQPICSYISEESQHHLMLTVNRDSASSKVTEMLAFAEDLIEEMEHNYALSRKRFTFTADGVAFMRKLCALLALTINYLMLFNYHYTGAQMNYIEPEYKDVIEAMGSAVFALSVVILILWCVLKAKLTVSKGWKELLKANIARPEVVIVPGTKLSARTEINVLMKEGPDAAIFNRDGKLTFGSPLTSITYRFLCFQMILSKGTFQYFCLYSIAAAMGWWDIFFYSFLLLDVMYMFPTLHNVFRALTVNGNQIIMTSLLGLVLIYIYALWGFYIDPTMYYDPDIGEFGESLCQSLWECFLTTLNNVIVI